MTNGVVLDNELLYRVIKRSRPDCINSKGEVSPALFKDKDGVSVDRDGDRTETEVISFIIENTFPKRAKAVTMVSAKLCFEIELVVEPAPSLVNPFHANIFMDADENKRNIQALKLADNCRLVYYDPDMEWTGTGDAS